jgi:hypothetical protein
MKAMLSSYSEQHYEETEDMLCPLKRIRNDMKKNIPVSAI